MCKKLYYLIIKFEFEDFYNIYYIIWKKSEQEIYGIEFCVFNLKNGRAMAGILKGDNITKTKIMVW